MKTTPTWALACALFGGVSALAADAPAPSAMGIQRGAYLVNEVGLCADCHTPRDERGQFVRAAWLMGAPIGFKPTVPMPAWAEVAPPIAGLPTLAKDEEAVRFLTTGVKPDGTIPRPPMPGYRFNEADARDVLAYLRSLTPSQPQAPGVPTTARPGASPAGFLVGIPGKFRENSADLEMPLALAG